MNRKQEILQIFLELKNSKKKPLTKSVLLKFIREYKQDLLYEKEFMNNLQTYNRDDLEQFIIERLSEIPMQTFETRYDNLTDNGFCKLPDDLQLYIIDKLRGQPMVSNVNPITSLSLVNKHFYNLTKNLKMYYTRILNMPMADLLVEMGRNPTLFLDAGPFLIQIIQKFFEDFSKLHPATLSAVYNRLHLYPVNFKIMRYNGFVHRINGGYKNLKDVYFGIYELEMRMKKRTINISYDNTLFVDDMGNRVIPRTISHILLKSVKHIHRFLSYRDENYVREIKTKYP